MRNYIVAHGMGSSFNIDSPNRNLATKSCKPETCKYSRNPIEMRPVIAEDTVKKDKQEATEET